jgi:hypothetical protein
MAFNLRIFALASSLVLFIVATAQGADITSLAYDLQRFVVSSGTPPASPGSTGYEKLGGSISVSSEVPLEQYQQLVLDWAALTQVHFANPDPVMLQMMKIPDGSSASLLGWLQDRIHVVVSEKFSMTNSREIIQTHIPYPNEGSPTYEDEWQPPDAPPGPPGSPKPPVHHFYTVMSNIGAAIYDGGVTMQTLFGLQVPGVGLVPVPTPRAGIIQIGAGLFAKDLFVLKGLPENSIVRQIFRISTFFHEARHSDGHGVSRSFFHATCPRGDFAGQAACDRNLNGPYALEASVERSFYKNCSTCTVQESEVLKAMALDSASRVIKMTIDHNDEDRNDFRVNEYSKIIVECQADIRAHIPLPSKCNDLQHYIELVHNIQNGTDPNMGTPTTNWDDAPEKVVTP